MSCHAYIRCNDFRGIIKFQFNFILPSHCGGPPRRRRAPRGSRGPRRRPERARRLALRLVLRRGSWRQACLLERAEVKTFTDLCFTVRYFTVLAASWILTISEKSYFLLLTYYSSPPCKSVNIQIKIGSRQKMAKGSTYFKVICPVVGSR